MLDALLNNLMHTQLSSLLTPFSWLLTLYVSLKAFRKNDISRQKDKIISNLESLFKDLNEKLRSASMTEDELDEFLTGKTTIIELQLNNINKRVNYVLLSPLTISKIRSEPIDMFTGLEKRKLLELEFDVMEEIEDNYTELYFRDFHHKATRFFVRLKNKMGFFL